MLIWFDSFHVDKLIDWYFYHIFFFFSRRGYGLIMERDSSSKERNGDSSFRLVTWNSESVSNFLNFHVHNTHTQNAKLITLHLCFKWTWSKYLKSIPSFEDMLVPLQCNEHSEMLLHYEICITFQSAFGKLNSTSLGIVTIVWIYENAIFMILFLMCILQWSLWILQGK